MSSQPAPKTSSRWGSFLQQAVAGVESRLDTILADDDGRVTKTKDSTEHGKQNDSRTLPAASRSDTDISRQTSTSKKNDRLQERLAKAVVARNTSRSNNTSTLPSRNPSPSKQQESPRTSLDSKPGVVVSDSHGQTKEALNADGFPVDRKSTDSDISSAANAKVSCSMVDQFVPSGEAYSLDSSTVKSHGSGSARLSSESTHGLGGETQPMTSAVDAQEDLAATLANSQVSMDQMRSDYEAAELRRQEETHLYIERIDVLQAKLQYLTREAIETAKKRTATTKAGSSEQMIAEKDEKIALLMEEGQNLSQNELKHMNTIRKLRAKSVEDERRIGLSKRRTDELEKSLRLAQERAWRAETVQREATEKVKILRKVEKELESARAESGYRASQITELQSQLALAHNDNGAEKEINAALDAEKAVVADLRDDLSNARIERKLSDERHRAQIRDLHESFDQEREKAKLLEMELRGELNVLESRLEKYRTRAEEISSSRSGDAQAKLLRQIETLQTQYSEASENWRGIEGSLLTRISGLEKDRDDTMKKEADLRRKARELHAKCRHLEEQFEQATNTTQQLELELAKQTSQLENLTGILKTTQAEVAKAESDLRSERESWQTRLEERLDVERSELNMQTLDIPLSHMRAESPPVTNRKKSTAMDRTSPHDRRHQAGAGLGLIGTPTPSVERPTSRRSSAQPAQFSSLQNPQRNNSLSSTPQLSISNGISGTPPTNPENQDDFFDGVVTPATPERTINDMISVSTAAAGPSLQLVERMSATVRRLESEKAAAKDEFDRLTLQRDQARDQVVDLMRESEKRDALKIKLAELEMQVFETNRRYQTTLEMLGEKTERVEELEADIADVKQMYRDLVESTMR